VLLYTRRAKGGKWVTDVLVLPFCPLITPHREDTPMKNSVALVLAMLAGIGIGGVGVQSLRAQAKPPVYYISEIDVKNIDAYTKEYAPKAQALIKASGGRILAAGQKVTSIEGAKPKPRVVVQVWDSMEKIKAWRDSAEFKELRKTGNKYAKFRAFTVEGLPE
jgi:uncharacterized protein (DUF1330 family)